MVEAWIPRDVEVLVGGGDDEDAISLGSYRIRPPTAREAITILEVYRPAALQDEDAWTVFSEVIRGWLPPLLAADLITPPFQKRNAVKIALDLLNVGVPTAKRKKVKAQRKRLQEKVMEKGRSWASVVAEYRHLYSAPHCLDESWTFFLGQVEMMDHVRALDEASYLRSKSIQYGKENQMDELTARLTVEEGAQDPETVKRQQARTIEHMAAQYANGISPSS